VAEEKLLFITDLQKPGMLTVLPLTASIPRGRIVSINLPTVPKGCGVIRPEEIPGRDCLVFQSDKLPLFAGETVEYPGQTLLLVYGPEEEELRSFRDGIRVEYDTDFTFLGFSSPGPEQIFAEKRITRGKSPGKTEGVITREDRFELKLPPGEEHRHQGAFAYREKNHLTVYGTSQWPFFLRDNLTAILGTDEKHVTFRTSGSGHASDGPLWYPALLTLYAALAAWITGKPCRLIIPPEESLTRRRGPSLAVLNIQSGLHPEGRVLFRKISVDIDGGARPILVQEIL